MANALATTQTATWLDDVPRIEAASKLRNEKKRSRYMQKRDGVKVKAWDCDGQYVFFRRKIANPATLQRLTTQVAKGELKYLATSDDVEMYEVQKSSPFHRPERDFTQVDLPSLSRMIAISACKLQWADYLDGLEELASRYKNAVFTDGKPAEPAFMKMLFGEHVTRILNNIRLRGGPSQEMIDRELGALRARRGDTRSRQHILLPS